MLTIVSSAKTLNWKTDYAVPELTQPQFLDKSEALAKVMKGMSKEQLGKTLEVNKKLADLNFERFKSWKKVHTIKNARPAIASYAGQVFWKLRLMEYTAAQKKYLQKSIRIMSGLYGVVRPYDLIQPYRLEMGAKVSVKGSKDLYDYWKESVTKSFIDEAREHKILVNLASKEYADVVDFAKLPIPTVTVTFRQEKNGKLRSYGIPTRTARSHMLAYIIEEMIEDLEGLKKFDRDGNKLVEEKEDELVFVKRI